MWPMVVGFREEVRLLEFSNQNSNRDK